VRWRRRTFVRLPLTLHVFFAISTDCHSARLQKVVTSPSRIRAVEHLRHRPHLGTVARSRRARLPNLSPMPICSDHYVDRAALARFAHLAGRRSLPRVLGSNRTHPVSRQRQVTAALLGVRSTCSSGNARILCPRQERQGRLPVSRLHTVEAAARRCLPQLTFAITVSLASCNGFLARRTPKRSIDKLCQ